MKTYALIDWIKWDDRDVNLPIKDKSISINFKINIYEEDCSKPQPFINYQYSLQSHKEQHFKETISKYEKKNKGGLSELGAKSSNFLSMTRK